MINGAHVTIFSRDAEADRAFFKDVLGLRFIDAGGGWPIFALPPAEVAVHPDESGGRHELYLLCTDIDSALTELEGKGIKVERPVQDTRWGRIATIRLPGGGELGIYQPKHPLASSSGLAGRQVMNGRRFFFRMAYLLGWKPWDSGATPPELIEWVEGPTALAPGRALDIGCGTGTNCRYLLDHKWAVTGIDFIPRALDAAKLKAPGATLLVGDVTRLRELGVSGPFDLMLDLGCFHSIPEPGRDAYVREVAHVAAPGAMLLMFAFGEKGPGTPVAPEEEIRRRFGGDFDVAEVRPGAPFRKQTWYRMLRKAT